MPYQVRRLCDIHVDDNHLKYNNRLLASSTVKLAKYIWKCVQVCWESNHFIPWASPNDEDMNVFMCSDTVREITYNYSNFKV